MPFIIIETFTNEDFLGATKICGCCILAGLKRKHHFKNLKGVELMVTKTFLMLGKQNSLKMKWPLRFGNAE